ncbi:recombination protein RecR [Candidatus Saccharibacteria bacterium]|nr:recombination protein RecR [Candidatus Saccharibacteria bacterium]
MKVLPKALTLVIDSMQKLPGVGPRSAERYAYFLLKSDPRKAGELASSLAALHEDISYCPKTFALIDKDEKISPLYSSPSRNKQLVAVVEDPFDVVAIENTGQFSGTYHVLNGLISPIDGISPESLHINELVKRVREDGVKELIIATNASVEGESTAHYIASQFDDDKVKITRLAQGMPIGLDIEYADQITLGRAIEGRKPI